MNAREKLRIGLLSKYTKILDNEPNCDIEPLCCKVCGDGPHERLHPFIEHCLAHVRRNELEPIVKKPDPVQETVKPGVRPLEMD